MLHAGAGQSCRIRPQGSCKKSCSYSPQRTLVTYSKAILFLVYLFPHM